MEEFSFNLYNFEQLQLVVEIWKILFLVFTLLYVCASYNFPQIIVIVGTIKESCHCLQTSPIEKF